MTTTQYFIAVSADPSNQITIYGLGHTADEAIQDAVSNAGIGSNDVPEDAPAGARDVYGDLLDVIFVAEECTKALYEHVETQGGADLSWTNKNADGLADLLVDAEDEVSTPENGSVDDLTAQLIKAGVSVHEKEYDEEETAEVLYVQLSRDSGWRAAFAPSENHLEMEMTRWSSGKEVLDLFAAIGAKNISAIVDYADDIASGWDSDWTN